ncbi:MAG: CHASE2 domain-containing protein [Alphaproteobacteria bacterium]
MTVLALLRRSGLYLLPLSVLVLAVALRVAVPDFLDRGAWVVFDLYQRAAPRETGNLPIRIVDIDEASLKDVGQWPWPRGVIAKLVDRLREAGASVVGFDIAFAEPDRTAPRLLAPLLAQNGLPAEETSRLLASVPDPDAALAETIRTVPVVTGFILDDKGGERAPAAKAGFAFVGDDPLSRVARFSGAIPNLPAFETAAAGNGFLNQHLDWDNVVRRVPLLLKLDGRPYPSLVAEVLRVAAEARSYVGRGAGAQGETGFGANTGMTELRIGPLIVPTDAAGRVTVHFAPPPSNLYVSAKDVLAGTFDRSLIDGNIVLVGTSATGVINDRQATPLAPNVPGVEIHAQLIDQILRGDYLVRPDWAIGAETLFVLLVGAGLIWLLPRIGALPSAAVGLSAVTAAMAASWLAFQKANLLIDAVYPTLVLISVYIVASLLGYLRTETRQREIRNAFSRYMSPHYVAELARHPEKLTLGGEMRVMTILFCDIRGFTSLAEGMDAQTLTHFMNRFLSPMTEIITNHKGTIDKYIGDCIMAFWNAPLDDPDHAGNAVRAVQEMRRALIELNRQWEAEAVAAGRKFSPVKIGIGLNTGECVVGNFGSMQRFDYSLLGDPVNLASRLEGLGKVYGLDVIIGEETAARLDDPNLIEVDVVAVKGKSQASRIYTIPPEPEQAAAPAALQQHQALLTAYRRQEWNAALNLLTNGNLDVLRYLAPVYDLYKRRIAQFQTEPPPADWDGVFALQEK